MGGILYNISNIITFLIYSFIFDYFFEGRTIGKMIVGIKVIFAKDNKMLYCFLHGILRLLSYVFIPLTVIYYLNSDKQKLPYDGWFHTTTIDSKS